MKFPFQITLRRVLMTILTGGIAMALFSSFIPSFGSLPSGKRLERVKASPHYQEGEFKYIVPTPMWTGEASVTGWLEEMILGPREGVRPSKPLPMIKTNLIALDKNRDIVVWLGHSSFYLQLGGKRILVDPVFSSRTSPVPFIYQQFKGEYPYSAEDMPDLDYVVISHDHWDHLDYPTLKALRPKVKTIVTPLGVGAHLEYWGYEPDKIREADWYEQVRVDPDFAIYITPSRHFSGRGLTSNQTLWGGFVFVSPQRKVFYSGDGGYGPHFAEIGKRFGTIDIAIVENGQYDERWAHMHMMPEEALQAALDVDAKAVLPVHAGRFALANHNWDEPYERITAAAQGKSIKLLTPEIGEQVDINAMDQVFSQWWKTSTQPAQVLTATNANQPPQ